MARGVATSSPAAPALPASSGGFGGVVCSSMPALALALAHAVITLHGYHAHMPTGVTLYDTSGRVGRRLPLISKNCQQFVRKVGRGVAPAKRGDRGVAHPFPSVWASPVAPCGEGVGVGQKLALWAT